MSEKANVQNTQDTEIPTQEEDTWLSLTQYILFEVGRVWDSWLDFRLKLLIILLAWLVVNIGLIRVAWRVYGTKVTETFGNEGTCSDLQSVF